MRALVVAVVVAAGTSWGGVALATAPECGRTVVVTLVGVTWEDVSRVRPPELLALVDEGAVGSMSTRVGVTPTGYGDAFATLGAGSRARAPKRLRRRPGETDGPAAGVIVANAGSVARLTRSEGYRAAPGALAEALGRRVAAVGVDGPEAARAVEPWPLLAAMDASGVVAPATVGVRLTEAYEAAPWGVRADETAMTEAVERALAERCSVTFVDHGDLLLQDTWAARTGTRSLRDLERALLASDRLLGRVVSDLDFDRDLLLVLSPTSPLGGASLHLGVAVARGPGFAAGSLETASTRQRGIVTLPDVAPTVLAQNGEDIPSSMTGRPWRAVEASGDRVEAAVELDRRSRFAGSIQTPVITAFVAAQVAFYALAFYWLTRARTKSTWIGRFVEYGALAVVAFPAATYVVNALPVQRLGFVPLALSLVAADAALVGAAAVATSAALDRLLGIVAVTLAVLTVDLALGGPLQLNAVFGNYPLVGGRFVGLGNTGFAVLGAATIVCGALLVARFGRPAGLVGAALVFVAAVIVDGAPQLGSDVGGVLALVPALGVTGALLAGRRLGLRVVVAAAAGAVVFLAAFIAWDLAGPAESRSHLGRLVEQVMANGSQPLIDAIERKVRTNLSVFGLSIWTYFVPPALAVVVVALLRWRPLRTQQPALRVAVIGLGALAALGFVVNDSGITIPAMVLAWLVPLALLGRVSVDRAA